MEFDGFKIHRLHQKGYDGPGRAASVRQRFISVNAAVVTVW